MSFLATRVVNRVFSGTDAEIAGLNIASGISSHPSTSPKYTFVFQIVPSIGII